MPEKFRFFIIDKEGVVTGTNDRGVAVAAVMGHELAVIDSEFNIDMTTTQIVQRETQYAPTEG